MMLAHLFEEAMTASNGEENDVRTHDGGKLEAALQLFNTFLRKRCQ
jgi:hypothetical protein